MQDEFDRGYKDITLCSCLNVDTFFVIRKIIVGYNLDVMVNYLVWEDVRLFLDLVTKSILIENNSR